MSPDSASYWHSSDHGIACELCPHRCQIAEGQSGLCQVRRNEGGVLILPFRGRLSALALDPIEKKPLYHFLPGSMILSAGFAGCNLCCPFCQNWQISQRIPEELQDCLPGELVAAARAKHSVSIAYTYSEPTVHFEFVRDCMKEARKAGLKNVLVTNGCLNPAPAGELLALTDATNIDLKTWSSEAYSRILGGDRDTVLAFIKAAAALTHVEITTLIVPKISDSQDGIQSIAEFIAGISPDIPLHLSAYHPDWNYHAPASDSELVHGLAQVARKSLRYVYLGNLPDEVSTTHCSSCGAVLIRREGYRISTEGLKKVGEKSLCRHCNSEPHIIV